MIFNLPIKNIICLYFYIQMIFKEFMPEIAKYETLIRKEFEYYKYDTLFLYNNANSIRKLLPIYKKRYKENPKYAYIKNPHSNIKSEFDVNYDELFPPYLVKAFLENKTIDESQIQIFNYLSLKISIIGTGTDDEFVRYNFKR